MAIQWWQAVLIGLAGGLINALLTQQGVLWWPKHAVDATGRHGWDLGFLANLLVGAAAGWLAVAVPSAATGAGGPQPGTQAFAAFVAGIGGSAFVNNFLQQRHIQILQEKVDALDQTAKRAVRTVTRRR